MLQLAAAAGCKGCFAICVWHLGVDPLLQVRTRAIPVSALFGIGFVCRSRAVAMDKDCCCCADQCASADASVQTVLRACLPRGGQKHKLVLGMKLDLQQPHAGVHHVCWHAAGQETYPGSLNGRSGGTWCSTANWPGPG